jgi:hypothetical protein
MRNARRSGINRLLGIRLVANNFFRGSQLSLEGPDVVYKKIICIWPGGTPRHFTGTARHKEMIIYDKKGEPASLMYKGLILNEKYLHVTG